MGVLTAIPLILTIVALQLPTRKVAGLFETLASADTQLHESIEEGLLEDHHIKLFTEQLKLWVPIQRTDFFLSLTDLAQTTDRRKRPEGQSEFRDGLDREF